MSTDDQLQPAPRLDISSNQVDLGKVEFAASREVRRIAIRNAGGRPLQLHEIALSCNCLEAKPLKSIIEPGDESAIEIALDRRRLGPQQAQITLRSNDPVRPEMRIHFKWLCSKKIDFLPPAIDFNVLEPQEYVEKEIAILGAEGVDAEMVIGERNASSIKVIPLGDSRHAVALVAPEVSGQYYDEIRLVSRGGESLAVLPIRWSVVSPVEVTPRFFLVA